MTSIQLLRLLASLLVSWFIVGFILSEYVIDEKDGKCDTLTRIVFSISLSVSLLFFILFFLGILGPYISFELVFSLISTVTVVAFFFRRKSMLRKARSLTGKGTLILPNLTGIEYGCLIFSSVVILLGFFKAFTWPFMFGDALFRWHYLGLMTFKLRGFWYYPPITPEHFRVYFMAEGMPPFVQLMYAWVYFSINEVKEGVARLFIGLLMGSTVLCTLKLGEDLFERRIGYISILLLTGSSFFFHNMLSGEGALGECFFLTASIFMLSRSVFQESGDGRLVLFVGFLAGFSALSRYEGIFGILSGLLTLVLLKSTMRRICSYLLGAAICFPWYFRNWLVTGNPIYPYLAELFPTNKIYYDIHVITYRQLQTMNAFDAIRAIIAPSNLVTFGFIVLGGLVSLFLVLKNSREKGYLLLSPILMFVSLWLIVAPMSGGGVGGALRYLIPIFPILATCLAYLLNGSLSSINPQHLGQPKVEIPKNFRKIFLVLVVVLVTSVSSVNLLQITSGPHPGLSIEELAETDLIETISDSIRYDLTAETYDKKRLLYESHYKLAQFLERYCKDQVVVTDQATLLPFLLRKRVMIIPSWSPEVEEEILSGDLNSAIVSLRRKNIRFFLLWEYGGNMNNKYLFESSLIYRALHNPQVFTLRFRYVFYWRLYELKAT